MHITCAEFVSLDPYLTGRLFVCTCYRSVCLQKVAHGLKISYILNIVHNLHYEGAGQSIILIIIMTIITTITMVAIITTIIMMMIMTIIIITIIIINCTIRIVNNIK